MTAGEYCNREIIITGPESTITEAARLMRQHHVGTLVVVEREGDIKRPIGVVSDRDLVDDKGSLQGLMSADDAIELIAEAMGNLTKVVRRELSNEQKTHP